jgi:16S rRNA processing protein RimM
VLLPEPPEKKRGSTLESSSSTDRPEVRVGRLGKPNGLEGFIGLYVEPASLTLFEPGSIVYVEDRPHTVREVRDGTRGPQVAFEDVNNREAAEAIRGQDVYVVERRDLGEGEFWPEDLIGLEVRPGGGVVTAVSHGAAQDRLVIDRQGITFEVPFVNDLVPTVDVEAGFVEILEIEGLS